MSDTGSVEESETQRPTSELESRLQRSLSPPLSETGTPIESPTIATSRTTTMATSDPIEAKWKGYFIDTTAVAEEVFLQNQVVIRKDKRGAPGSKEFNKAYQLITEPLEHKFGAAKHFVVSSSEGEVDNDNTKYKTIQDQFVGNLTKLDPAELRCIRYDLMDILNVPLLRDKSATSPAARWSDQTLNLFHHWSQFEPETIFSWQMDTNEYGGDINRQSSSWLFDFLYNSSTAELRERVQPAYEALRPLQQGGIVYLYLLLTEMFQLTRDVVQALKDFIKNFTLYGVSKIQGENISIVTKQLRAVCVRLDDIGALPEETPQDILKGLTVCSVQVFKDVFQHQANEERINALRHIHGSGTRPIERVKQILQEANDLYDSLSTSNQWVGYKSGRVSSCWNCGGPHGVGKCTKPKDEQRIADNRRKFNEEKARRGDAPPDDKAKSNSGYQRKPWKPPDTTNSTMGIANFNGDWMMKCNRGCGWNYTHTTKFHNKWKSNPSTFALPGTHPYHLKTSVSGGGGGVKPSNIPVAQSDASRTAANTGTVSSLGSWSLDRDAVKTALEAEIRNTPSGEVAAALEAFAKALLLN
jgi:hypothetical protein